MSTHIIYDMKVLEFCSETGENMIGLFILSGSSNTYTYSGVRSRDWGMVHCETYDNLMASVIEWSSSFVGANTTWRTKGKSGELKPQQWIRKVRKAISECPKAYVELLERNLIQFSDLVIRGKDECQDMKIGEILKKIQADNVQSPGKTTWQYFRVTGPNSN